MGEIVKLGKQRKERAKAAQKQEAKENRVRYGRTGAEKKRDEMAEEQRDALLSGARISEDKPQES